MCKYCSNSPNEDDVPCEFFERKAKEMTRVFLKEKFMGNGDLNDGRKNYPVSEEG